MRKILDEFTDLPISRQRKYQLRKIKNSQCRVCGKEAVEGKQYCQPHLEASRGKPQPE